MIDDYPWQISEIVFSRVQIPWLLSYLEVLRAGSWPIPRSLGGHRVIPQGNFVALAILVAEIDSRLGACGVDGAMCELYYTYKKPEHLVAKMCGCYESEVIKRIDRACLYMSGRNRRKVSYWEFVHHRRRVKNG